MAAGLLAALLDCCSNLMRGGSTRIKLPTHPQLVAELKAIRRVGLTRLRELDLQRAHTGLDGVRLPRRPRDPDADFVVVESGPHVHQNLLRPVIGDDMAGT